jgi:hypothetical protein
VRALITFLPLIYLLGACSDQLKFRNLDKSQDAAVQACLKWIDTAFPDLQWLEPGIDTLFLEMGDLDQASLSQSSNGDFVFKYPNVAKYAKFPDAFVCRGNLKQRKILSFVSQQTTERPVDGQVWSY